jgi:hypothetical protein
VRGKITRRSYFVKGQPGPDERQGYNVVAVLVGVACTIALFMPLSDELCRGSSSEGPNSSFNSAAGHLQSVIPDYLHVTINQKLIFAYALGKL